MELTVGFSSCPNDTFMFDAMVHHRIDTGGLSFRVVMEDIEQLNRRAFSGALDITKVSYHAFAYLRSRYDLLHSGSALGRGCGPLLISKQPIDVRGLADDRIGVPGRFTTANMLLQLYLSRRLDPVCFHFSEIESALVDERIDAGVIIHENRFTYQRRGLLCIQDLGHFWEKRTGLPVPLGGIVIRRELGPELRDKVERLLRNSIEWAIQRPLDSRDFVKAHAQEVGDDVIRQHIDLYVNEYSLDLGFEGSEAVKRFLSESQSLRPEAA
jgi:1,4-dihydroxy-6-naphthoate synthase